MTPLHTLNPTMPVMVPVAVPVAVLVPTPRVARRVQPQPPAAKPAEAKQPTTLETVAKVVDNLAQIAGVVGKFFNTPAGKPTATTRVARPMQPSYAGHDEMLPDAAFDGGGVSSDGAGGDWGFGGVPDMPAMPEPQGWDFGQMMPNFDPNALPGGFDPTAGW